MTGVELADVERVADAARDCFRLEALPTYLVPQEAEEFEAWRRGDRVLVPVEDSEWLRHIRDTTAAGVHWWRVRIVDYPLTDYTAYELHGLQGNAAAGEEVLVADRAWSAELAGLHEDFWVFDNEVVIRMIYDDEGHFVRPEQATDTDYYLGVRAVAVRHAVTLSEFLARHEPQLSA